MYYHGSLWGSERQKSINSSKWLENDPIWGKIFYKPDLKGGGEIKFLDIFNIIEIIANVTSMAVDSANLTYDIYFLWKSQS